MQVERQGQRAMLPSHSEIHVEREEMNVQVLIIGGGPAGLGAGITAGTLGLNTAASLLSKPINSLVHKRSMRA
jgi:heterodisulfide reductase subunit A-like polyferredoxin